jgi:hypothetical protein
MRFPWVVFKAARANQHANLTKGHWSGGPIVHRVFGFLAVLLACQAVAERVSCPASRDVWLSSYRTERDFNMGAAAKLKLKIHQEFALLDFDVRALRGRPVRAAWLNIKPVGGHKYGFNGNTDLSWLTVSTVAHAWTEGRSTGYRKDEAGHGATFNESSYGKADWGWPGAKVCDVALGHTHTLRCDARLEKAENGRWRLPLDARLVQALVAGASHGLLVMDGSGYVVMNCFVASRESGEGPFLEVELGPRQDEPRPGAIHGLGLAPAPNSATDRLGALLVSLTAPRAFSYDVECNGEPVARWQIPLVGKPGSKQEFVLRDLPADTACTVRVRPVSALGTPGEWATATGRTSGVLAVPSLPRPATPSSAADPPTLGAGAVVYALPPLTKLDPVTGKGRGDRVPADVARGNPVWDAKGRQIVLDAAKGDIVSFQLVVDGPVRNGEVAVNSIPNRRVRLWRNWYVQGLAEYAMPWNGRFAVPMPDNAIPNQRLQTFTIDIHVPPNAPVGRKTGTVRVTGNGQTVALGLRIQVHRAILPDTPFFRPELNGYGGPGRAGSERFRDSHRLAHYHRCSINRVPYNQSGRAHDDVTPKVDGSGQITDWTVFDEGLGGLLDGSWFADNPRSGVPVPTIYLPLHEGWPLNFRDHYHPGVGIRIDPKNTEALLRHDALAAPPEQALDPAFNRAFATATRAFYDHFREKGWNRTLVECYLNDKPHFGYTVWTLDEPVKYRDWAALNHFARLFKNAIPNHAPYDPAWHRQRFLDPRAGMPNDGPTFVFRADVSRPEWQGSVSDGLMTLMVANNGQFSRPRTMAGLARRLPAILYAYGSCNKPERSDWESVAWCVQAFAHGCEGVVPWQSLAGGGALRKPDPNGLIVDAGEHGHAVASLRVHALREGAQICELLRLLQIQRGWSRDHIRLLVGRELGLASEFSQRFSDEAAALSYANVDAAAFLRFRRGLLALLDAEQP